MYKGTACWPSHQHNVYCCSCDHQHAMRCLVLMSVLHAFTGQCLVGHSRHNTLHDVKVHQTFALMHFCRLLILPVRLVLWKPLGRS